MADGVCFFDCFGVKLRVEKRVELFWFYAEDSLFFGYHAFVDHVDGNLKGGVSGALAVPCLEHEELAAFNGKLHVLHIPVMLFKRVGDGRELLVNVGQVGFELVYRLRRADTRDDVFALRVDEVFAEQFLFACRRVPRERNACAGIVARVAENHFLYVYCGAP